jgi:hypothetical protein
MKHTYVRRTAISDLNPGDESNHLRISDQLIFGKFR